MSVQCKPGTRLFSDACEAEVIVVKGPADPVELTIGGREPVGSAADRTGAGLVAGADGGTQMGKRYVDEGETLEILCTKPGAGTVAVGGVALELKDAKALPASD